MQWTEQELEWMRDVAHHLGQAAEQSAFDMMVKGGSGASSIAPQWNIGILIGRPTDIQAARAFLAGLHGGMKGVISSFKVATAPPPDPDADEPWKRN